MSISGVLQEAWQIYRRLFRRSVVVAGLIFAVVGLAESLAQQQRALATSLVALMLGLVGGLLVQGALVEVVRDLHEGREPASINVYYDRTRDRLGTLLGASIMFGLGAGLGFLLFIVPGLIAVARWSLTVPLVMIERLGWSDAFRRSSQLVRGRTGRVLVLVIIANVIAGGVSVGIASLLAFLPAFWAGWAGGAVAGAIAVPYEAHVLTVLYYRLTEPETPILPEREGWRSIWDEEGP